MQLPDFERQAEALLGALNRERYRHAAGLQATLDLEPIYDRYPDVTALETYAWLDDQPLEPADKRSLLDVVATHLLEREVVGLTERLANAEAAAQIVWHGERLPLRTAIAGQAGDPDRDRRHWLNEQVRAEMAKLAPPRLERRRIVESRVDDLGYPSPLALGDALRGLQLADLATVARSILDRTEDAYRQALRDQLAHHQLDPGDAWAVDLDWIVRGAEYDAWFAEDRRLPALAGTFGALGIRIEDQQNVRLDLADRALKAPGVACLPIAVPGEVVVVVRPVGGRSDLAALLGGFGQAERFAYADRTAPFGRRWLGDAALGVAYAGLFRSLAADPAWLQWRLELDDPRDVLRLAAFERLVEARRLAATLDFALGPGPGLEPEQLAEGYAERLTEALGVRCFPEESSVDADLGLVAATDLRGRLLECALRAFVKREYDEEWFRSPRAGRFLIERWREGQRYAAEELAHFLGFDGLPADLLVDELTSDPAT